MATLERGDIVTTGTLAGVGLFQKPHLHEAWRHRRDRGRRGRRAADAHCGLRE
ncbi:MAG TPA: hypothetical protein VKV96_03225 [Roseiarcus sp.]|nr:hypothetical protein [Roseiarcus sp.]